MSSIMRRRNGLIRSVIALAPFCWVVTSTTTISQAGSRALQTGTHAFHGNYRLSGSVQSQVTPELLSPLYSRSVPARWGCARRRWFQDGDGITPLQLQSISARDVPSVLISVGPAI